MPDNSLNLPLLPIFIGFETEHYSYEIPFSVFLIVASILTAQSGFAQRSTEAPKREFRGVWIATVANIDWPTRQGMPAAQQRAELIAILDAHQRAGINAIMFQIRPGADALYGKSREPWSAFLSGTQGRAPSPVYDPLDFAIKEAHSRGMELHAWMNPYRATFNSASNVAPDHITRKKPEWFFTYGGKKYFNPALPEVRSYISSVVMDVVRNYDVDGIHFDDYFYPYPEKNPIPDAKEFRQYGHGFSSVDDWRRNNVDQLIKSVSDSIFAEKKYIKFGISPLASGIISATIRWGQKRQGSAAIASSMQMHGNGPKKGGSTISIRRFIFRSTTARRPMKCWSTGGQKTVLGSIFI